MLPPRLLLPIFLIIIVSTVSCSRKQATSMVLVEYVSSTEQHDEENSVSVNPPHTQCHAKTYMVRPHGTAGKRFITKREERKQCRKLYRTMRPAGRQGWLAGLFQRH